MPERKVSQGDLHEAPGWKEQGQEAKQEAVERRPVRSQLSVSGKDVELLLDERILGDEGLGGAGTDPPTRIIGVATVQHSSAKRHFAST